LTIGQRSELWLEISWAGAPFASVGTFNFILGYSAAAIDSTAGELADAINNLTGGALQAVVVGTATNVIDDAAVTATLAGGIATGADIDASNIVVSVDKATHIITLTDAVTVADGDQIRLDDGSQTPTSVLEKSVNTFDYVDSAGVAQHGDVAAKGLMGNVRATAANLRGYSSTFMLTTLNNLGIRVQ